MPSEIRKLMQEMLSRADKRTSGDDVARRLQSLRDLYSPTRYRPDANGKVHAAGVDTGGVGDKTDQKRERTDEKKKGGGGGSRDKLYRSMRKKKGDPAKELKKNSKDKTPTCVWVSSANGSRAQDYLEDRAARYIPEENTLHINADFRGFVDTKNHLLKKFPGLHGSGFNLYAAIRTEFETKLCETVLSVRGLQGSANWSEENVGAALNEEALTAAVLPRYHVVVAVEEKISSEVTAAKSTIGSAGSMAGATA
jgi:hypothetical protein